MLLLHGATAALHDAWLLLDGAAAVLEMAWSSTVGCCFLLPRTIFSYGAPAFLRQVHIFLRLYDFECFMFPTSAVPRIDSKPSKDVFGWAASHFQHVACLSLTSKQHQTLVGPSATAYSCCVGKQFMPPFMLPFAIMVVAFVPEFVASGCSFVSSNSNFIFMLLTHYIYALNFFLLFFYLHCNFKYGYTICFLIQIYVHHLIKMFIVPFCWMLLLYL